MEGFQRNIRKVLTGLLLPLSAIAYSGSSHAYCESHGNSTYYEWVERVWVGVTNNSSGDNGGYGDFTGQVMELSAGANNVILTPGFAGSSYTENWKIWIDLNHDGELTEDESVFGGASSSTLSGSLSIPETAVSGMTRMRVSMQYGGTPQPCSIFTSGEVEDYTVNLNTTDTTSPTVVSKSPDSGSVDVSPGSLITVVFSEDIDPVSVNDSTISIVAGGVYASGGVSVNGKVLTFTPNEPLAYTTDYTATVYAGVLDLAGNALMQDTVWSFTTAAPDVTPPTVTDTSPDDGAIDVDNNWVIQAYFSEAMDPATINSSTFTISGGFNAVTGNVVLSGDGKTAQFYLDQPLEYLTQYTATISAAAKDIAGNPLASDHTWSFTSREYQPDYCTSHANNVAYMWIGAVKVGSYTVSSTASGVGYSDHTDTIFDLSRTFSRVLTLTPGYSSYAYTTYWKVFIDWNRDGLFSADETVFSGSGNSAINGSITVPSYAVAGNTRMRVSMQYGSYPEACGTLTYGEVEDFRVSIPEPLGDYTPPEVTAVSPVEGAQNVSIHSNITVDFSEEIEPVTIDESSLILSGGVNPVTVAMSYDAQNKRAVFIPTNALEPDTFYTATLGSGISDVSGNQMLDAYVWSFTTEPQIGPAYTVSGAVQSEGSGLANVLISVTGDAVFETTTDTSGSYSLTALPPGNYTITPSLTGYTFTPESVGLTVVDTDISAVDFGASFASTVLTNGDFELASFEGYTLYTTANGNMNPSIVSFDTNNDGSASLCAKFYVGIADAGSVGTQQGGGIYQTVTLSEGDLSVSVDIAAAASLNNGDGGLVELYLDGVLMDSHNFGSITGGVTERASLSFSSASVTAGNHEIRIQVTRVYMLTDVRNYVDNIILTGTSTQ